MSAQEKEVDGKIRSWPRTPETDPYKIGLEAVGRALQERMPGSQVRLAYNEFCAPSLEEAAEAAVKDGARRVTIITTMYTRGGVHAETEIPQITAELQKLHPGVDIRNVWPFSLNAVSDFLAGEVERVANPG